MRCALSRIRNERNQAMTDVKKLSETADRLRKDRNTLKAAMQDIVNSGGIAPTAAQFEGLQQEVALLKDEKAGLTKIIEHDKAALRAAEDENAAMTLQISLMNEDIDDKNALIEECQEATTDMLKKYSDMEIMSTTARHELESAKSVIVTMKAQHDVHRFLTSYSHHPPSLSTFLPPPALAISSLSCVDNTPSLSSLLSMAPGENWMTMRCKSPSSPKPSAQLPAKQLTSPLLPLFSSPAPRPASTQSSAERAVDGCPSPDTYWDQPDHTDWDFDNNFYCGSTGCSYDAKKNPRIAKYAITVAEFDDCSYEEYEDTVFLCGQCNMKCLRKVNGSKIKRKIPIEQFLAQQGAVDDSDSFAVDALDLPLPPPSASDFPELPRAAPAPKMTKAEKAMANKINTLLLSDVKGKPSPAPASTSKPPSPIRKTATVPPLTVAPPTLDNKNVKATPPFKPAATPGILPVTGAMRSESPNLSSQTLAQTPLSWPWPLSMRNTLSLARTTQTHAAYAALVSRAANVTSCTLLPLRSACGAPSASTGRAT